MPQWLVSIKYIKEGLIIKGRVKLAVDVSPEVKQKLREMSMILGKTQTEILTKLIEREYERIRLERK